MQPTITNPFVLIDADVALLEKMDINDQHMYTLLIQHYPTGLPPEANSWAEAVFNALIGC